MSSGGQLVGGVVGGIAGAFIGGPAGAYQGAALGMAIGGALDPPKGPSREGPRINDLSLQTSTYGAVIPRIYGTVGGVNGNIFWLENNQLKEVATETEEGGKGGGSTSEVTTYSYFATVAIGVCEGEIGGVRRIWAGARLIYDAGSDDVESIRSSNRQADSFDFYTGSETQTASSRMQADLGVGNVSAYRGLSYIVIKDFPLEIYGNAIPPFKFEVVGVNNATSPLLGASSSFPIVKIAGSGASSPQIGDLYSTIIEDGSAGSIPYGHISYYNTQRENVREVRYNQVYNGVTQEWEYSPINGPFTQFLSVYSQSTIPASIGWSGSHDRCYINRINDDGLKLIGGWSTTESTQPSGFIRAAYYDGDQGLGVGVISSTGGSFYLYVEKAAVNGDYPQAIRIIDLVGVGISEAISVCYQGGDIFVMDRSWMLYRFDILDGSLIGSVQLVSQGASLIYTEISTKLIDGDIYFYHLNGSTNNRSEQVSAFNPYSGELLLAVDIGSSTPQDISLTQTLSDWDILGGVLTATRRVGLNSLSRQVTQYNLYSLPKSVAVLSAVVENESIRTGILEASDLDASELIDSVNGYRITKVGGIREGIVPLQGAYPFDTYQSGYIIKYAKRGRSSIATIDIGDLGVNEQLKQARDMDTQLPRKVVVKYLDSGRDYDMNDQYSERINTDAVNTRTIEMPVVLGATKAAQIVESLIYLYWLERTDFGPFTLPPTYSYLEPADVITLNAQYATYELRLLTVDYKSDGSLVCSGRLNNPSVYQSDAVSDDVDSDETIEGSGTTLDFLVDAPMIDETIQNRPGFGVGMSSYSKGWPGGLLFRSGDGGQSWQDLQAFTSKATMGQCGVPLQEHAGDIFELGSELGVSLISGTLSSISQDAQLTGGNIAAYGVDGRWEIISFRTATLQPNNSYLISDFMRGLKGTEWATGLHEFGDRLIILQSLSNQFIGVQSELIGVERLYRSVTSGDTITSAPDEEFTYQGVNLKPLSGVDADGNRDLSGDLTGTWYARTRVSSSWWTNGIPGPTGEASEAYEIDIMNGSTVVRTINTVTPEFLYTAAEQTTDFGSVQSSIDVRIYQMSEAIGRGFVYEVTL